MNRTYDALRALIATWRAEAEQQTSCRIGRARRSTLESCAAQVEKIVGKEGK